MALYKPIKQQDGVVTSYHRILYVTQTVNSHNSIAVVSYTDDAARASDLPTDAEHRPYRHAVTYETDYDEGMTVSRAYDYLKTLTEYEDAEDV